MLEHKLIARADYDGAIAAPVTLRDSLRGEVPVGVHFKEQVRRELIERFGKEQLYRGRLKVYTTIDIEMQKAAESAGRAVAERDRSSHRPPGPRSKGRAASRRPKARTTVCRAP